MKRTVFTIFMNGEKIGEKFAWNSAKRFVVAHLRKNMPGPDAEQISHVIKSDFSSGEFVYISSSNTMIYRIES